MNHEESFRIAGRARLFRLLSRRPELRSPDRETRIRYALIDNSYSLPLFDAALVIGATDLDRLCGHAVKVLSRRASADVVDLLAAARSRANLRALLRAPTREARFDPQARRLGLLRQPNQRRRRAAILDRHRGLHRGLPDHGALPRYRRGRSRRRVRGTYVPKGRRLTSRGARKIGHFWRLVISSAMSWASLASRFFCPCFHERQKPTGGEIGQRTPLPTAFSTALTLCFLVCVRCFFASSARDFQSLAGGS